MTFFSNRLARIKTSPTMAITSLAAQMKADGHDVIGLSVGEPDFNTPEHVRDAAKLAMDQGQTRYTAVDGTTALKRAICEKFHRDNGLDYSPENITVGSGGKQILFNALMATLNSGDEVIIPAPYWVSYPDMVALAGGTPVIVPCPQEDGFRLTAAKLEAAITPATKWLILNSPSNPTGAGYDRQAMQALCEVLMRHPHVWILTDDIYEYLTFDGFEFCTPAQVEPRLTDRVLTLNGVSKSYAMTGWRIGYGGGPKALIQAVATIQSQSTSNPCSISQEAAIAALRGPQDYRHHSRAIFQRRRDMVVAALNACPGLECPTPQGAFYVYPSMAGLLGTRSAGGHVIDSDQAFCTALLQEQGIAVVFGAAFGLSPHFRVSYATSDDILTQAMGRILQFCQGCRPE